MTAPPRLCLGAPVQLSQTLTSLSVLHHPPFFFLFPSLSHHISDLEKDEDEEGGVDWEGSLKKKKRKLHSTASPEHFGHKGSPSLPVPARPLL